MMGTEILKIDAEMAEKIEVEVGNPNLKTDRKSWLMMWFSKKIAPTVKSILILAQTEIKICSIIYNRNNVDLFSQRAV